MAAIYPIATTTVGSGGSANIEFTSIPGTYTDLLIKFSLRDNYAAAGSNILMTFNSSTTSYSEKLLLGTGAVATFASQSASYIGYMYSTGATGTANTFGNGEVYIPNYAGSNNKSVSADTVQETNDTTAYIGLTAGLWSNTAAITSIKLAPYGTLFSQYSTATLYGIR